MLGTFKRLTVDFLLRWFIATQTDAAAEKVLHAVARRITWFNEEQLLSLWRLLSQYWVHGRLFDGMEEVFDALEDNHMCDVALGSLAQLAWGSGRMRPNVLCAIKRFMFAVDVATMEAKTAECLQKAFSRDQILSRFEFSMSETLAVAGKLSRLSHASVFGMASAIADVTRQEPHKNHMEMRAGTLHAHKLLHDFQHQPNSPEFECAAKLLMLFGQHVYLGEDLRLSSEMTTHVKRVENVLPGMASGLWAQRFAATTL